MRLTFKTKITCFIVGTGLLLGSCATSNDVVSGGMFSKRKYTNGYHSNLGKNLHSGSDDSALEKFKAAKSEKTEDNAVENATVIANSSSKSDEIQQVAPVIGSGTTNSESAQVKATESKKEAGLTENVTKQRTLSNATENNKPDSFNSLKKIAKKIAPKPAKDSSFIRVLVILILILVAIALLQVLLPGLVGNIFSLLLLALVIFLILRLFGVV